MPFWLMALLVVAVAALSALAWFISANRARTSHFRIFILSDDPFRLSPGLRARVLREVFDSEVVDGEVSVVDLEDFRVEFVDLKETPDPPAVGIRGPVLGSAMSLGFWGFAPRGKTPEVAARMDAALARVAGWFLKQPTAIGLLVSSRDGDYQVPTSPELIARLEAGLLDDLPGRADITDR